MSFTSNCEAFFMPLPVSNAVSIAVNVVSNVNA